MRGILPQRKLLIHCCWVGTDEKRSGRLVAENRAMVVFCGDWALST